MMDCVDISEYRLLGVEALAVDPVKEEKFYIVTVRNSKNVLFSNKLQFVN